MKEKLYKNKEWLKDQYTVQGKEASQIASEQNCSYGIIFEWLHKFNIRLRRKIKLDKNWLEDQYLIKHKSCGEIAKEFGYRSEKIRIELIKNNIKIRSLSEAHVGKIGWSKGLTKYTDQRVANLSQGIMNSPKYPEKSIRMIGKNNPMYNNHSMSGENNPMYGKGYLVSGEHNGMYGRKGELSPTFGRKLTKEQIKVWQSGSQSKRPTKPEWLLYKYMILDFGWEYSGDGSFWIDLKNGHMKNPDFKNEFENKVIEVFGDYWHEESEIESLIKAYRNIGWDCFIVWEHEMSEIENNKNLLYFLCEDNHYIIDDRYEDDK